MSVQNFNQEKINQSGLVLTEVKNLAQKLRKFIPNLDNRSAQSDQCENPAVSNFQLFDVLAEFAEASLPGECLGNPDNNHSSQYPHSRQSKQTTQSPPGLLSLQRLLETQLTAAMNEHARLPHHTYTTQLDWQAYVQQARPRFTDPNYPHQIDIMERYERAVAVTAHDPAKKAHHQRYKRELTQVQNLYDFFARELEANQDWQPVPASFLPAALRAQYHLAEEQTIFVGQKYGQVLPQNKAVYSENLSYVNLFQLVHIPVAPGQPPVILLVSDQYYAPLDHLQQRNVLNSWQENLLPTTGHITESLLLSVTATLPSSLRIQPAFLLFDQIMRATTTDATTADGVAPDGNERVVLAQRQQAGLARAEYRRHNIRTAATYAAHILLTEYLLCARRPGALAQLPARLHFLREQVFHPLLSEQDFPTDTMKKAYADTFWSDWQHEIMSAPALRLSEQKRLARQLRSWQLRNSQAYRSYTAQEIIQRDAAIQQIAHHYPAILTRVFSMADCALGSAGQIMSPAQVGQSNVGRAILQGHLPTASQLAQVVGQERAQLWHPGHCINPHCPNGQQTQLVGECQLCLRCELEFQTGRLKLPENGDWSPNQELTDNFVADHKWWSRDFSRGDGLVTSFLDLFPVLPLNNLAQFFLAENTLLAATR